MVISDVQLRPCDDLHKRKISWLNIPVLPEQAYHTPEREGWDQK